MKFGIINDGKVKNTKTVCVRVAIGFLQEISHAKFGHAYVLFMPDKCPEV